MNSENNEKDIDLRPVTKIIASYVGNHTLSPEQLPAPDHLGAAGAARSRKTGAGAGAAHPGGTDSAIRAA